MPTPRFPLGVVALFVLAQWAAALAVTGFSFGAILLGGAAAALVVLVATELAGRAAGVLSGVFYVGAPLVLPFWREDFRSPWRHELLPVLYGADHGARLAAGIALLLAVWAAVRRPDARGWALALVAALAAAALIRLDTATLSFSWSELGTTFSRIREVGWSKRVVEYLPLAGLAGLALRRRLALVPVLVAFLAAVVVPLGRDRGTLLRDAIVVVPGLPLYAVLVGCLTLLVPEPVWSSSSTAVSSRASRWARMTF
jgi:hypothetical protein